MNIDVAERDANNYDIVIMVANYCSVRLREIPPMGSLGSPELLATPPAVDFFAKAMLNKKIVKGALCHALWILTPVPELLKGRKVICHTVVLADVHNAEAIFVPAPENKEIWHMVSAKTNKPYPCIATQPVNESKCFPKQHSWKNALHSFEHALVGYIIMQQIHNQPVHLYYAFKEKPEDKFIYPYFYEGKVSKIVNHSTQDNSSQIQEVIFTDIL